MLEELIATPKITKRKRINYFRIVVMKVDLMMIIIVIERMRIILMIVVKREEGKISVILKKRSLILVI